MSQDPDYHRHYLDWRRETGGDAKVYDRGALPAVVPMCRFANVSGVLMAVLLPLSVSGCDTLPEMSPVA